MNANSKTNMYFEIYLVRHIFEHGKNAILKQTQLMISCTFSVNLGLGTNVKQLQGICAHGFYIVVTHINEK